MRTKRSLRTYGVLLSRSGYRMEVSRFNAKRSLFPAAFGEALGLDVESGTEQTIGGINASGGALYLHDVTLTVRGNDHTAQVGFMPEMSTQNFGILGKKGFFDVYQVKFSYLKGELELKEYSDKEKERKR